MRPPAGFEAERYPLQHRVVYAQGLCMKSTGDLNSTMCTLVRNYKGVNLPDTINVNPHHGSFAVETGSVCSPMSIIDKLKLSIKFNLTEAALETDKFDAVKLQWFPIFFSFPEKLDATDDKSSETVLSILELVKDATQEDVTPLWSAIDLPEVGQSAEQHPVSTVNLTETSTTLNLTASLTMESIALDMPTLFKALKYYTNRGALKSCMGKVRNITLTKQRPFNNVFIDKFVPRAIRRIVPYSFFAIIAHVDTEKEVGQYYYSGVATDDISHVGMKLICNYHEWNSDHLQEMM